MKAADKAASQILAQLFVGSSEAQAAGMPDVTNVVTSCFHALTPVSMLSFLRSWISIPNAPAHRFPTHIPHARVLPCLASWLKP